MINTNVSSIMDILSLSTHLFVNEEKKMSVNLNGWAWRPSVTVDLTDLDVCLRSTSSRTKAIAA